MYSDFFKLDGSPFRLNPDHRFFYVAEPHQKAIAHLQYALSRSEGFVVVTGEVGAGKTTLVNRILSELEESSYITGNIVTSYIEHADLIHLVASTFGIRHERTNKATLLLDIRAFLEEQRVLGRHPILFVDEVQNLPESSLEELRMLSNFSLPGESLLQIFLVGQPEFRETLADERMEQLRQRVITACHLGTLDEDDTRNYIAHRLRLANWRGDPSFSVRSFELIHRLSGGVPRRINQVCDRLLLYGFLEQIHRIDTTAVAAVARDMTEEGLIKAPASVLHPEGDDEVDADIAPAADIPEAAEPEILDTPLPEEFLAEIESLETGADILSTLEKADDGAEAAASTPEVTWESEQDPDIGEETEEEKPQETGAEQGASASDVQMHEPDGVTEDSESKPAFVEAEAQTETEAVEEDEEEAVQEAETVPESASEQSLGTESEEQDDAAFEPETNEPETAESEKADPEKASETEEELAAAKSANPVAVPTAASLPLYLPDEALQDGASAGRAKSVPRRWRLAAGAALAACIAAGLFALPEDWIQQHMINAEDLVVSQDLDLRSFTPGGDSLTEIRQTQQIGGDAVAAASQKKGPYIVPAATGLDGSGAIPKVAAETSVVKAAETTLVAAVPEKSVAETALPIEERFLIQLATLRTQEEAIELRDGLEKRFEDLLADFGLGVRHANIAGAEYYRVMTELGDARERMFDICTKIKSEDQSCILVLDTAAQARAVN